MPAPLPIAFFCPTVPYGLYTVFKGLRPGLMERGFDLRWIAVGPVGRECLEKFAGADDRACGTVIGGETDDEHVHIQQLHDHIPSAGYRAVILSPPYRRLETNMLRYLPAPVRRVLTIQSMSAGVYPPIRPLVPFVHAAIGCAPRVSEDLRRFCRFPAEFTRVIPNGIDLTRFASVSRPPIANSSEPLRVLYLGRLEKNQKGIFWLPDILRHAAPAPITLTIAGDGPDAAELRRRCAPLGDRVSFAGVVDPRDVPTLLARHDALILPSRSEGFGIVIIEAMAAGCVPVVSRIRGVTDYVVRDEADGLLFPIGDVTAAAAQLRRLHDDVELRQRLAQQGPRSVAERFSTRVMAEGYADVLRGVLDHPRPVAAPLPLDQWRYPFNLGYDTLRRLAPRGLKNMVQRWVS